jgi:hypothetical protein
VTTSGGEWLISMAGAKTERDLALAIFVAKAIDSLWDAARRRLTGRSGSIRHIKRSVVEMAIRVRGCPDKEYDAVTTMIDKETLRAVG